MTRATSTSAHQAPARLPRRVALAALVAGLTLTGAAQAQRLVALVDRTEANVGDQIRLQLTVEGTQEVGEPQLPELPAFDAYPRGRATQMQVINGRASQSISFNYLLVPKQTGEFLIGPAKVVVNGRELASEPIRVRVVEGTTAPQEDGDIWVEAQVSTTKPYVGQQVIYTWRLFRRVQMGQAQLDQQSFDGFLVEDLGEAKTYQKTINGQQYAVHELRKAIFPQRQGSSTVPAAVLHCDVMRRATRRSRSLFDDFFGSSVAEPRVLRTPEIAIEVRPLPAAPPGYSGLVGSFDLKAKISKQALQVGESATFELTVSGSGNVQSIPEVALEELPRLRVYDDKPESRINRTDSGLSGSKTFRRAVVPLEPGEITLPGPRLVYFDPERGSYQTAASADFDLTVAPLPAGETLSFTQGGPSGTTKSPVRLLDDDLLPLSTDPEAVARPPFGQRLGPLLILGLLAPPLLFAGLSVARKRQLLFAGDARLRRRHAALRTAQAGLQELRSAAPGRAAAELASRCLRTYVGDKAGAVGAALTPEESAACLTARGVAAERVAEVRRLLEELEAAQYGAATVGSDLASRLEALIGKLEGDLR